MDSAVGVILLIAMLLGSINVFPLVESRRVTLPTKVTPPCLPDMLLI